jgi:hypothetical protein
MLKLETRHDLSRTVLTVCLGYVLALHLLIAGLANATRTAQSLDTLASPDLHAFCLSGAVSESSDEGSSRPIGSHQHDLCCTLACGVSLLAPTVFATVAYAAIATTVVSSTSDFGARLSTAPPGLGQGPRAPPVFS